MRSNCIVVVTLLAGFAAAAQEKPPAVTLERLDAATKVIDAWPGTFLLTTRATISRTDGSKPERSASTMRMAGGQVVQIVSATKDGKDVTAEARERSQKGRADAAKAKDDGASSKKAGEKDGDGFSLDLPGADSAGKYAFTPLAATDGECGAAFAPARGHAGDAGLTKGELHWSCTTLDPLWIAVSPARNPTGLSEMSLRFELARSGETLFVARTVTDGVGGILFIKRRFHVETEVSELTPPEAAAAAAP